MSVLTDLSTALADAVDSVAPAMVRVEARRGYGATGLVWKSDGVIVTANHVVQRDEEIMVSIAGNELVPAGLVGRDRGTDIAVLKVQDSLDQTVRPAESTARVGNLVLALGAQTQSTPAASFGVVATINRPWRSPRGRSIDELIRSDVTLYPGFSGGPLIDAAGRVVGMNTSALARGLATTLPWPLVEQVAEALVSHGSIKRGYLGVSSQPVEISAPMQENAGVEQATGLLVVGVEQGSPAGAAGVFVGDILIQFGDQVITGIEDLQEALGSTSVGSTVQLGVIRGGTRNEIEIAIGERA